MPSKRVWAAVGLLLIVAAGAYGLAIGRRSGGRPGHPRLRVLAAASLTVALGDVAAAYERESGVGVDLACGSSGALAQQILNGAPADLFISANVQWMDSVERAGLCAPGTRRDVLSNVLVVVAPRGQAGRFRSLADLAHVGRLAIADSRGAPAGIYAREALARSGLWGTLSGRIVEALHVRAALLQVERGEADAGIVFLTDARSSDAVEVAFEVPRSLHAPIVYPAAVLKESAQPAAALAFLEFLSSTAASSLFEKHGFIVRVQ